MMTKKFNEGDIVEVVRKVGDGDMSYDVGDTFTISSGVTQSGAYGTIYETIEGTWIYEQEIALALAAQLRKSLGQAIEDAPGIYVDGEKVSELPSPSEASGKIDGAHIAMASFGQHGHGRPTPGKRVRAHDTVNSPAHYANSKIETIDYMADKLPAYTDGFTGHCAGNVIKYVSRAPHKHENPIEDLEKAKKYLEFAIEHEKKKLE